MGEENKELIKFFLMFSGGTLLGLLILFYSHTSILGEVLVAICGFGFISLLVLLSLRFFGSLFWHLIPKKHTEKTKEGIEKIRRLPWLNIFIVLAVLFLISKNELDILTLGTLVAGIWALLAGKEKIYNIAIGLGLLTLFWGFFADIGSLNLEDIRQGAFPANSATIIGLLTSMVVSVVKEREENLRNKEKEEKEISKSL